MHEDAQTVHAKTARGLNYRLVFETSFGREWCVFVVRWLKECQKVVLRVEALNYNHLDFTFRI